MRAASSVVVAVVVGACAARPSLVGCGASMRPEDDSICLEHPCGGTADPFAIGLGVTLWR